MLAVVSGALTCLEAGMRLWMPPFCRPCGCWCQTTPATAARHTALYGNAGKQAMQASDQTWLRWRILLSVAGNACGHRTMPCMSGHVPPVAGCAYLTR